MSTIGEINAKTQSREDAEKTENILAAKIIEAAIEVHRTLGGPGLLESLYEEALYFARGQQCDCRGESYRTRTGCS